MCCTNTLTHAHIAQKLSNKKVENATNLLSENACATITIENVKRKRMIFMFRMHAQTQIHTHINAKIQEASSEEAKYTFFTNYTLR